MTRSFNAESFRDFIEDERSKIARAFREVEQVQVEYQGAYTRFKTEHDKTLAALTGQIEAQGSELAPALRELIDARVPVERQAIAARIAELEKESPKLQKHADALVSRAQKDTADLHAMNPKLNDQEEKLKTQIAQWQQKLDDLNAQAKALSKGLGFILNVGKINTLDRERFRAIGHLEGLGKDLNKVRQEWRDLRTMADKEQKETQAEWQTAMAQIGQLKQEHDYLAENADTLARHRAIVFVLDNLKTPLATNPPLDAPLGRTIELNIQTDDFQAALGSVAGILGVMKGVDEGLKRLRESATALISEQSRHGKFLPPLQIELAGNVTAFGAVWDDLAAKSKDEKSLAQHPAHFVTAIKPFLDERLTKDHIVGYFNSLGNALKRATAGWKG
jgi:predicted  nucleic acid-binding Zn-ribbon protein